MAELWSVWLIDRNRICFINVCVCVVGENIYMIVIYVCVFVYLFVNHSVCVCVWLGAARAGLLLSCVDPI